MTAPVSEAPATRRPRRPVRATVAAALVVGAVVLAVYLVDRARGGEDRQQIVAERGATVMPFELDATTHIFEPTSDGGLQTVVADDPTDDEQVELIRQHLRAERSRFAAGDFGDPITIHGQEMPGLDVLQRRADQVSMIYRDRPDGGQIRFRSDDPSVVDALHDWFDAQLADHGDHAEGG